MAASPEIKRAVDAVRGSWHVRALKTADGTDFATILSMLFLPQGVELIADPFQPINMLGMQAPHRVYHFLREIIPQADDSSLDRTAAGNLCVELVNNQQRVGWLMHGKSPG